MVGPSFTDDCIVRVYHGPSRIVPVVLTTPLSPYRVVLKPLEPTRLPWRNKITIVLDPRGSSIPSTSGFFWVLVVCYLQDTPLGHITDHALYRRSLGSNRSSFGPTWIQRSADRNLHIHLVDRSRESLLTGLTKKMGCGQARGVNVNSRHESRSHV